MVTVTIDELRNMMDKKCNIRNMSLIAQLDHGKSPTTRSLIASNIITQEVAGDVCLLDKGADQADRARNHNRVYRRCGLRAFSISRHEEVEEEEYRITQPANVGFVQFINKASEEVFLGPLVPTVFLVKRKICTPNLFRGLPFGWEGRLGSVEVLTLEDVPLFPGNTAACVGLDRFITKNATLIPVLMTRVLPSKVGLLLNCSRGFLKDPSMGVCTIEGFGEFHLEICLRDLQDD
ncbi:unnamed protein product [Calypogeia fissa]